MIENHKALHAGARNWYNPGMSQAIREEVIVQPGGVIHIARPALPVGATADVTVVIREPGGPTRPMTSYFGQAGCFRTADEVDSHVRAIRDEWQP